MSKWSVLVVCGWGLCFPVWASTNPQSKADSLFAAGKYAESLKEHLKSVPVLAKAGACKPLAVAYLQIGRLYYYLHLSSEARTWIKKSLHEAQACGFDSLIGINYRNLGALFIETGKSDSALVYLSRAGTLFASQNLPAEMATLFAMRFELYARQKHDLKSAKRVLDSCFLYSKKVNNPNQMAFYYMKEGIFWEESGKWPKAEGAYEMAAELYRKVPSTEGLMYALSSLSSSQIANGNAAKALQTMREYMALRDTVFKTQTAQNLARYQVQFEIQKKEIENLELKHENERQLVGFGLGMLVLGLGGFGVFGFREIKQRRRREAEKREDQRIRFSEVLQAQEDERTRIARDLHDGLGHLMAAIKLNTSAIEVPDEQNRKILNHAESIIDQAAKEVRLISHRLMPQTLSDLGLAESIRELAHRVNESGKIKVEIKAESAGQVEKNVAIAAYRIVQEVLNNTLKHAQATLFSVEYRIEDHVFSLKLSDNGKGFDVKKIEQGSGIGWQNIRSRVELVKGTLALHSEPGVGTRVEIFIPLSPQC